MFLKKILFILMNNAVFRKTMENIRKQKNIKLAATQKGRQYLVPEPNYHTTKFFIKKFVSYRNEKNCNNQCLYQSRWYLCAEDVETSFDTSNN